MKSGLLATRETAEAHKVAEAAEELEYFDPNRQLHHSVALPAATPCVFAEPRRQGR